MSNAINIWGSLIGEIHEPSFIGVSRVHSMDGPAGRPAIQRKVVVPRRAAGTDFVNALGHGISLLECWGERDVWLTNTELTERSGLKKSTVSRLTAVLEGLGYVARDKPRGPLRLTARTLELGFGSAFALEPVQAIRPELARMATELNVYASVGIHRMDKVQVVDNAPSPLQPHAVPLDVGGLLPMCRSASGLAVMSALPDNEAGSLVNRLRTRYGTRWQTMQAHLQRTKQEYTNKGFCTAVASLSRHVGAVAIPVIPARGEGIFAVGCGMPAAEFYRERVEDEIVPRLLRVARDLQDVLDA